MQWWDAEDPEQGVRQPSCWGWGIAGWWEWLLLHCSRSSCHVWSMSETKVVSSPWICCLIQCHTNNLCSLSPLFFCFFYLFYFFLFSLSVLAFSRISRQPECIFWLRKQLPRGRNTGAFGNELFFMDNYKFCRPCGKILNSSFHLLFWTSMSLS